MAKLSDIMNAAESSKHHYSASMTSEVKRTVQSGNKLKWVIEKEINSANVCMLLLIHAL